MFVGIPNVMKVCELCDMVSMETKMLMLKQIYTGVSVLETWRLYANENKTKQKLIHNLDLIIKFHHESLTIF